MKRHPFAAGILTGVAITWVYHHFAPGKGIGMPGSVTSKA